MRRDVMAACLLGLLGAMPLSAQETACRWSAPAAVDGPFSPVSGTEPASPPGASTTDGVVQDKALAWETPWGLAGLQPIPAGLKVGPNGQQYHPNFRMDMDFNCWIWRSQRLYLYGEVSLWGETGEHGVTNGRDGFLGTSKREFDLLGGAAWNYAGPWEASAFGDTENNLNRGVNSLTPAGFADGFGMENRYYLSPEYAKLGETGFDVARATFLSIGYFPSKNMVGNDGKSFKPGMMLRAYLICDLWDWPCYVFGDAEYISERSFQPKLLLLDVGVAARPFSFCQQWEFRLGVENTGDVQERNVQNVWYASLRFIF
jgi:hypothetical protein